VTIVSRMAPHKNKPPGTGKGGKKRGTGKATQGNKRRKDTTAAAASPVTSTRTKPPDGATTPTAPSQPPWTSSSGRAGKSGLTKIALPNGHATVPRDILERREEAVSTVTVSTKPSETWFESTRPGTDADEARRIQLISYVRQDLFPGWKFFTDPRQLVFDASETSLVRHICLGMHVKRDFWADWWELNKTELVTTLNRKRTDVTAMVKKIFIGTVRDQC
jgi:hypothetical protein